MLQIELYLTIIIYGRNTFMVQATEPQRLDSIVKQFDKRTSLLQNAANKLQQQQKSFTNLNAGQLYG